MYEPKHLFSEIINQKKQLIFKVEQTDDIVYPNEEYKYYIYIKNISGVPIENIHVKVNNPVEINIKDDTDIDDILEIGTLENEETKFIYLSAKCGGIGEHFVHFICYGSMTGLFYKTLKLNCSYHNTNDSLIHRVHIYDFKPYEDTYELRVENFSDDVTQLFKTQKLPFKAGEAPFPMIEKDNELTVKPFSNIESESFINQNDLAKNTREHAYQYISRENFNKSGVESYEGKNIRELVETINRESKFFKASFIKTGTNKLNTDFRRYEPDGFIYRFGLLNSEIYHYLGTLPTYSYMSDFLFRWAPDGREPLGLYPQKIAMKWDQKKWAGQGWIVYKVATQEYLLSDDFNNDVRWEPVAHFSDKTSAETYVERQKDIDAQITNHVKREYEKFDYIIKESLLDTGVFFIHLPISKIPSNFYLLDTESIEALIQRAKPFGARALIRYMVEETFDHNMEMAYYPVYKPYTEIFIDDFESITYNIQSKKYGLVKETVCGKEIESYRLRPYGKAALFNEPYDYKMDFNVSPLKPTIYMAEKTNELKEKNIANCKDNTECINYVKNDRPYPDNTINQEIDLLTNVQQTVLDTSLKTLRDIKNLLYQNNFDNIAFSIPSNIFKTPTITQDELDDSQNSKVQEWMTNNGYKTFSLLLTKEISGQNQYYHFSHQDEKCDSFRIPIERRDLLEENDLEIGIGCVDIRDKYHLYSLKFDKNYKKDYIRYATVYNNNFQVKEEGYSHASSLVIKVLQIDDDLKNNVVIFFIEQENKLHYYHHIIIPNLSEIFIYMSNDLTYEKTFVYCEKGDGSNPVVYIDEDGNELPCGNKVYQKDGQVLRGSPKYVLKPIDISKIIKYSYNNNDIITFETPYCDRVRRYESTLLQDGGNWTNLYRINKAENSYTYIENKNNEILDVDNIILHFDNIDIPEKSLIKEIKLKTILMSSKNKNIYCEASYQNSFKINELDGNELTLFHNIIECYPQTKQSQSYYYEQIEKTNNPYRILEYVNNITENMIFDESFDFSDNMIIRNPHWVEMSGFTEQPYSCNDINNIEFVIEGYNKGPETKILSQFLYSDEESGISETTIPRGYFYLKIYPSFNNSFILDWLRLRFRFKGLNDEITIFDTHLNILFKNKQNNEIEFDYTDEITNNDKNVYWLNGNNSAISSIINNGISMSLEFDSLDPGEFYRIYSTELEIIYQEQEISFLVNKNKFYIDENTQFYSVSGVANNCYLSGSFYTDENRLSQIQSSMSVNNLGIELKDTLYQSFKANTDNITAIEIHPNGFRGNPNNVLKIGIYENRGNTPGRLIKEIYANGWSKTNKELKNLDRIKYEINVDGLIIGNTYWFKIEVDNPNPNSYYLLQYSSSEIHDFRLLAKENNNYINTFGSLEFSIYSKNLSVSFSTLPTMQDYLENPYIKIGLHRGTGTLKNLKVKRLRSEIDEVNNDS